MHIFRMLKPLLKAHDEVLKNPTSVFMHRFLKRFSSCKGVEFGKVPTLKLGNILREVTYEQNLNNALSGLAKFTTCQIPFKFNELRE